MNCQLCKNESEVYRKGQLPEGIKVQVEHHLSKCNDCAEYYQLFSIAEKVMEEEKAIQVNPFLSTRVMAHIEIMELQSERSVYEKALKPSLLVFSAAAAIFLGIIVGGIYKPMIYNQSMPVEMLYMNDAALESIDLISNE